MNNIAKACIGKVLHQRQASNVPEVSLVDITIIIPHSKSEICISAYYCLCFMYACASSVVPEPDITVELNVKINR